MNTTQIICLGVFGYVLSCVIAWLYVHTLYSKGGSEEGDDVDKVFIFLTLCPGINTFVVFMWICYYPKKRALFSTKKFFAINNKEKNQGIYGEVQRDE